MFNEDGMAQLWWTMEIEMPNDNCITRSKKSLHHAVVYCGTSIMMQTDRSIQRSDAPH